MKKSGKWRLEWIKFQSLNKDKTATERVTLSPEPVVTLKFGDLAVNFVLFREKRIN